MTANTRPGAITALLFATTAWGSLFLIGKPVVAQLDPAWFTLLRYTASKELYPLPNETGGTSGNFPEVPADVKAAARVTIDVEWTDAEGKVRRVPVNEWIQHAVKTSAMPACATCCSSMPMRRTPAPSCPNSAPRRSRPSSPIPMSATPPPSSTAPSSARTRHRARRKPSRSRRSAPRRSRSGPARPRRTLPGVRRDVARRGRQAPAAAVRHPWFRSVNAI